MSDLSERIRKLLALSTSSNEAEAAAAYAKAHELLKQHNLTMADVSVEEKSSVTSRVVESNAKEEHWKRLLISEVADANYCAMVVLKWGSYFEYKIFGREENIVGTEVMFNYLCGVVRREAAYAKRLYPRLSAVDFKKGMVMRLAQRMRSMKIQESSSTALMCISSEAQDALNKSHPNLKNLKTSIHSGMSARLGAQAAESVSLHRQVSGSSQEFIGG